MAAMEVDMATPIGADVTPAMLEEEEAIRLQRLKEDKLEHETVVLQGV